MTIEHAAISERENYLTRSVAWLDHMSYDDVVHMAEQQRVDDRRLAGLRTQHEGTLGQ